MRPCSPSLNRRATNSLTHRLEEEALVWLLVLPAGAVEEAVAEGAVVDAAVPPAEVGRGAREPLHSVVRPGTLCKEARKEGGLRNNLGMYIYVKKV